MRKTGKAKKREAGNRGKKKRGFEEVSRGRKIVLAVVISGVVVLFSILALTFIFSAPEVVEWHPPTKAKIACLLYTSPSPRDS